MIDYIHIWPWFVNYIELGNIRVDILVYVYVC